MRDSVQSDLIPSAALQNEGLVDITHVASMHVLLFEKEEWKWVSCQLRTTLKVTFKTEDKGKEREHGAMEINHFITANLSLFHKANNFLADEDKEPCSSPCASSMAEESEEDSMPSSECKKVNDCSTSRRGAEAVSQSLRKT